ncbi:MAG: archease [Nanoarchaeota archaeon]|nr:archease [Nanoarchaeota archaeon]
MKSTQKSNGEKKGRKPKIKTHENEKKYVMLRHTATADVAFEAYGDTESELLIHAGLATESVMVELSTIKPVIKHEIAIAAETFEKILKALEILSKLQEASKNKGLLRAVLQKLTKK